MHVSGSAAARHEEGVGWGRGEGDNRGRAGGRGSRGGGFGVHAGDIAEAAATRVVEVGGGDGRVGLGDVVGGHFCCGCG